MKLWVALVLLVVVAYATYYFSWMYYKQLMVDGKATVVNGQVVVTK